MKYFWLLLLTALPVATTGRYEESNLQYLSHPLCQENPVTVAEKSHEDYQIRISSAGEQSCQSLEILKGGKLLYHDEEIGGHFYFGDDIIEEHESLFDLVGNGNVHLVFSKWTGGAHCCYSLYIFELGQDLKSIVHIDGGNFLPYLEDLNKDGIPEIKVTDDFLAYQFSSFAYSATADVVLKYQDGSFGVAAEYMKKPGPDFRSLLKKMSSWQKKFHQTEAGDYPPPPFVQTITDLVYSGNKDMALDVIDRVWSANIPGKADFVRDYEDALRKSRFYGEFERLLR